MLEILQFYTSGFWVWLGITIGIGAVGQVAAFTLGLIFGGRK